MWSLKTSPKTLTRRLWAVTDKYDTLTSWVSIRCCSIQSFDSGPQARSHNLLFLFLNFSRVCVWFVFRLIFVPSLQLLSLCLAAAYLLTSCQTAAPSLPFLPFCCSPRCLPCPLPSPSSLNPTLPEPVWMSSGLLCKGQWLREREAEGERGRGFPFA